MRWYGLVAIGLLSVLTGCERAAVPIEVPAHPALQIDGSATFTVHQRTSVAVPGSNDSLILTIDDITRGQTMASLEWIDGVHVAGPRALYLNQDIDFSVAGQQWRLTLSQMHNELIGDDWAEFTLSAHPAPNRVGGMNATLEIEQLIDAIGRLQGVTFVRNGQSYSASAAAEHLARKWRGASGSIDSAEDFILSVGSRSQATGEPYTIRMLDGSVVPAEEWMRQELRRIRSGQTQ